MIRLEVIFALLDELRAETIELVEKPKGRDSFAFGEVHGRMQSIADVRERLNELVEANSRGNDDQ